MNYQSDYIFLKGADKTKCAMKAKKIDLPLNNCSILLKKQDKTLLIVQKFLTVRARVKRVSYFRSISAAPYFRLRLFPQMANEPPCADPHAG